MKQPTIEEQIEQVRRYRFNWRTTVAGSTYCAWVSFRGSWRAVEVKASKSREFVTFEYDGKTRQARYTTLRLRRPQLDGQDVPVEAIQDLETA